MKSFKKNNNYLITAGIIVISILGIGYFGFNAFYSNSDSNQTNPFEYNIDYFKESDTTLNHYTEIKQISPDLQKLYGIAIGPGDHLYVTGENKYLVYDQKWKNLSTVSCGETALALAVDQNKDVYLAMLDHIQIFNDEGIKKSIWPTIGDKSLITSIKVTSENVYIADAGNFVVWKYDKNGQLLQRIGEKNENKDIPGFIIPSPFFDLAVDPDGFLWVVNPGRLSLENYTSAGDLRSTWGNPGMDVERFCGCCNPSHIAILDDGSFVTGEKGIARVKVYNRLGQLVSVVAGPDQFTEGTVGLDLAVDSKNRIYVLDPKRKMVRIFEKKPKPGGNE
jgi:hypothetical protein